MTVPVRFILYVVNLNIMVSILLFDISKTLITFNVVAEKFVYSPKLVFGAVNFKSGKIGHNQIPYVAGRCPLLMSPYMSGGLYCQHLFSFNCIFI
jgi:hypothetical protein